MMAQLKQAQERIKSMALVHNKLYESSDVVHVYLKDYIADLASGILSANTPMVKIFNCR
jgi:two-component sensor histidine kinase